MRRREFITLFGAALAADPLTAHAQQSSLPVVGFISAADAESDKQRLAAFLKGLEEVGYIDGKNVMIEYRWAEAKVERLPTMAADLVQRQVSVIAATTTPAALAAQAATTTIPIVFESGSDPVRLGLVTNLNRPSGNVTGVTRARELLSVARDRGVTLHLLNASSERDFDAVFADLKRLRVGGLVIGAGSVFVGNTNKLAALTVRHSVPAIYQSRSFAAAGGLMSYGSDISDGYRLAGIYTGRVLKGESPAELPVVQPTKSELVINLKTAKALGLNVPQALLATASEVIE